MKGPFFTTFRNFVGSRKFTPVERVTSYLLYAEHTARVALVVDVYYRSVPQIRPPFATLALVQSAEVLWMLASFLRCHSTTETLNLTVEAFQRGGCGEREARGVAER